MYIHSFEKLPIPTSPYEEKVVRFCQAWMAGQDTFRIHTSGSTGTPKQLLLTRSQMIASAELTGKTFQLSPQSHALVCLNIDYIAGMMMLVRAMVLDLRITVIEPKVNPLAEIHSDTPIDFASFVPLQLQSMLLDSSCVEQLNRMKALLVGGAAVGDVLAAQIKAKLQVPVYSTYGMTETVSHIAIRLLNEAVDETIFRVLDGVSIGVDQRQCLTINSAVTNFETIQTNDIVTILSPNSFLLLGRIDNIINSGGVKVQLEKVEKVFMEMVGQANVIFPRAFAYGVTDEQLGQRLVMVLEKPLGIAEKGFIEISKDRPELVSLREKMKKVLSKYEIPKQFYAVSSFSETPTGKIDKIATIKRLNL